MMITGTADYKEKKENNDTLNKLYKVNWNYEI